MPKLSRGSFVILLMCGVALGLSIFAAWYRYEAGNAALRFWGKDAALRIRSAGQVTLLSLAGEQTPAKDEAASVDIQGASHAIIESDEIADARGLIHARHALLEDASLDEMATPGSLTPAWHRVLKFTAREGGATTVAIDLDTGWLCHVESGALIKLKEPDRSLVAYIKKLAPRQKDIDEAKAKEKRNQSKR